MLDFERLPLLIGQLLEEMRIVEILGFQISDQELAPLQVPEEQKEDLKEIDLMLAFSNFNTWELLRMPAYL